MGRKMRPGLYVEPQLQEGWAATGFIKTMGYEIDTPYFMNDVIELAHAVMSNEFDMVASAAALSQNEEGAGNRLAHVYEPGQVGIRSLQLWEHRLYGRGSDRQASFEFLPSTWPILKPEVRAKDPSDAMFQVEDEVLDELDNDTDYVFVMKAPIMEYGLKVTIEPINAKFLFIASEKAKWYRNHKEKTSQQGHFRFEKYNVPEFEYRNPQDPSGSDGTVGQFTALWLGYWAGGGADEVWSSQVVPMIEGGMQEAEEWIGRAAARVKKNRGPVSFNNTTFASAGAETAMQEGANLARAFIRGKSRTYRQAAKSIEKNGYFGGEKEY